VSLHLRFAERLFIAMGHTYKPNLVPPAASFRKRTAVTIIHLGRPLPNGSSDLPENAAGLNRRSDGQPDRVSLFGLAPRGVCLAIECYHRCRWALTSPFHPSPPEEGWSILCCTCRHPSFGRMPGRYPARCPLVFGLSSEAVSPGDRPVCLI